MNYTVSHVIAGKKIDELSKRNRPIYNPATGASLGQVNFASESICNKAVHAAREAFPAWAETTPIKRAQILFNFRELLLKHQASLARLVTQEHGKTLDDAKGSVMRGIEVVEFHCG